MTRIRQGASVLERSVGFLAENGPSHADGEERQMRPVGSGCKVPCSLPKIITIG